MAQKLFVNASVFLNGRFQKNSLLIEDEYIAANRKNIKATGHCGILENIEASGNSKNSVNAEVIDCTVNTEVIDCTGRKIVPGFVELHSHGAIGYDFNSASPEELQKMLSWYASKGITSIVPTAMTETEECMTAAMNRLSAMLAEQEGGSLNGARIVGIRAEGPFLGEDKRGAHDVKMLRPATDDFYHALRTASRGRLSVLDIDPTGPDAVEFIRRHRGEVMFSLAHTSCDYALAKRMNAEGVNHLTHLFNAMNGLHHREPGMIGALADGSFFAEIICDGLHVHPSVLRLMFSALPHKLVMISDSMSAAGLGDGEYTLGGKPVIVKDGKATLADGTSTDHTPANSISTEGTLAGSTTNLYDSLLKLIAWGIAPNTAIAAATENAAKSVGLEKHCGFLKQGCYADFLILNDNYEIEQIWIAGKPYCPSV